jgi:hypothetical protein
MTILIDPDGPLPCPPLSFVVDPALADAVEEEYDLTAMHSPTDGPNRMTLHVPTETTRLSLGQPSPRWTTDKGITGYTDSHIHFETKLNDKTVVSLGGPATTSATTGFAGPKPKPGAKPSKVPPVGTQGYAMVTEQNAWHDSVLQHYLLSRNADMSLRTDGDGKRAVIQADHGKVDLTAGKHLNVSGGGVSIAAGELEVEEKGYGEAYAGDRPHESAVSGTQITTAVVAALSALFDMKFSPARLKYDEGNFAPAAPGFVDANKWKVNGLLFGLAAANAIGLIAEPTSPEKSVKLSAPDILGAVAGSEISIYGTMSASLGSAMWTTVSAAMSSSMKAAVFAAVGSAFTSLKGYRKVEMASDWGKVFTGAQKAIHLEGEKDVNVKAANVAHVASPGGQAVFGGKKVWLGTPKGGGWGMTLDDEGLAIGKASVGEDLGAAKVEDAPSLKINATVIEAKTQWSSLKLEGSKLTITGKNKPIRFVGKSGDLTINGAKVLLK